MRPAATSFMYDELAVTSIEYALLGSLIAVVIAVSVTNLGIKVLDLYEAVSTAVVAVI